LEVTHERLLPQAVLEAADVSAVSQLVLRERLSRDLRLWDEMRDCFHDDSIVRIQLELVVAVFTLSAFGATIPIGRGLRSASAAH
jgi:hypothetical protein